MVFKFRLERILSLRQDDLEAARQELANAFKLLEQARANLEKGKQRLKNAQDEMLADNYKMPQEHMQQVRIATKELEKRHSELNYAEGHLEKCRETVIEAQQKVEALEKLKEKQLAEYTHEQNLLEQKQTDEKLALKHALEMQKKAEEEN